LAAPFLRRFISGGLLFVGGILVIVVAVAIPNEMLSV
jgi:hypothetical protein